MKQFTLYLNRNAQRPIVILKKPLPLNAMLDTGSLFPVWVGTEKELRSIGGEFAMSDVPFGGFGGMTQGDLYRIPTFCVGELIFPDFPVIFSPHELPCQILLSATMFSRLVYEIDDKNHLLNFSVPEDESLVRPLNVRMDNDRLQIFCSAA